MQFSALLALILLVIAGPLAAQEARKPEPSATHHEVAHHEAPHHEEPRHETPKHPAPAHKPPARHTPPAKPSTPPAHNPAAAPAAVTPAPAAVPAPSSTPTEPPKGSNTGLPLPRFASLKTDEVNLRTGPGLRYPIEWVYKRRDLPVEIQREFEVWRLVADQEGVKGWVHQATLVGRRTFVSVGVEQVIRSSAEDTASAVARLKPGVIGRIRSCDAKADWCQVQVGEYRGWLKREAFWGTYPGEAIQ
ncbi:SH3 domain-containing protein [Acidisphaera sp. L21]|uniref:SH3 domain-containing protein n=1 Tax=Acidisphaera sp. L21 TaxID=1641851 RepID=UPI00131B4881|nr:SH3 domain-containing protein [Acidisphaera sp. L21]